MTRICKIALFCVIMLTMALQSFAIERPTTLYVYGFSASFNDSTVYLTEIQQLDSAWVNKRTGFLYSRENYSYQLKTYLLNQGVVNPTCIISFAKTRKEIEKKYESLKKRYMKNAGSFIVKTLSPQDFKFEAISAIGDPNVSTDDSKEALKAEKEAEKKAKKEAKAKMKKNGPKGQGGRPQGPPPGGAGGPGGGMGGPGGMGGGPR